MKKVWTAVIAAVLVVAGIAVIKGIVVANRPLVEAPKGTAPLDNKLDTSSVRHLIADEARVFSEETKQILSIYNANWSILGDRVLAVVVVEHTADATNDAWQRMQDLSLGVNDALLLIEAQGSKKCALVSNGTFREDIATLDENFLVRLTYQELRAGDFDAAVLAVYERLHYLFGYDGEKHRQANATEGLIVFSIIAALTLPILLHMIAEKVDNRRFVRWYNKYGTLDLHTVPWRTAFFWHRAGSKWYKVRMSGEWINYRSAIYEARREAGVRNLMRSGRMR